jgi:WD40 repeat protein
VASPDGRLLAFGNGQAIRLWDIIAGREKCVDGRLRAWPASDVSPPEPRRVTFTDERGAVLMWNPSSGAVARHEPDVPEPASTVLSARGLQAATFKPQRSPDGVLIGARTLTLWCPERDRTGIELVDQKHPFMKVAFSPDGRHVATSHRDGVRLWDCPSGKLSHKIALDRVEHIVFSPDSGSLAVSTIQVLRREDDANRLYLYDVATGRGRLVVTTEADMLRHLAFAAGGRMLVTHHIPRAYSEFPPPDDPIRLWDIETGMERPSFRTAQYVHAVAVSPDGRTIATGGYEGLIDRVSTIRLWELETGQDRGRFVGHRDWLLGLAFSADGLRLLSTSADGTAVLWDPTGRGESPAAATNPVRFDQLWNDLIGEDARRAYRAVGMLAAPDAAGLVRGRLKPAREPSAKEVAGWLAALDDPRQAERDRASRAIEECGEAAAPALRTALTPDLSVEQRRRVERALERIGRPFGHPQRLREVRAVEALEMAGTPAAKSLLAELAAGSPEARLTREAKAALDRMKGRP